MTKKHKLKTVTTMFFTCWILFSPLAVEAYDNQNRLVQVWDNLEIFKSDGGVPVGAWNMTTFPYIEGVSKSWSRAEDQIKNEPFF